MLNAANGPGGDGACDETNDKLAFVLPAAYRPENLELQPSALSGEAVVVVGNESVVDGGSTLVAGGVYVSGGSYTGAHGIDGVAFRAAGSGSGLGKLRQPSGGDLGKALGSLQP